MEPKFGDTAQCKACGAEIIYTGTYWDHIGEIKPRHIAEPGKFIPIEIKINNPIVSWYTALSPREQATIDHARAYAQKFHAAGVPGHSAHLLIAKLADLLDGTPSRPNVEAR